MMGMGPMGVVMVIIWLASAGMSLVIAAALITYVIRTWQTIRAGGTESHSAKILDGIDQLRVEVGVLNDRLASLERPALKSSAESD